jgi:hypothetical protein
MATQRQIEANLKNSARSTGPTSEAGKARSRLNATKHGMAGESAAVEAGLSPEFAERRARWAPIHQPEGDDGEWALDQMVAASLRIERCGRSLDKLALLERQRARVAWGQDREVEAATIAGRLSKDPVLATRQLETTLAGVCLLLDAWFALARTLEAGRDWSEAEVSRAFDLLGIAPDARSGRTLIDPPDEPESESVAFRLVVVAEEVARLEALRDEALAPIEAMERQLAMDGDLALLSGPAKLLLRYEREAWRRYRESEKVLRKPAPTPAPAPSPAPAPVVPSPEAPLQLGEREGVIERNEAKLEAIFGMDHRTLLAGAAEFLAEFNGQEGPIDRGWVAESERKRGVVVAERSQLRDATAAGLAANRPVMNDRK